MTDKESARSAWRHRLAIPSGAPHWGKAAEKLRGLQIYRDAASVFATPGQSLHQARINCLADGKNLVMPGPSIREGFFLLPARSVPFSDFSSAVTYKGLIKKGQLLKMESIPDLALGLLLTDSLAVDIAGGRLGDGHGFFDLCCALLQELGGLHRNPARLTFILEEQLSRDLLPQDVWDIQMTGAITPARTLQFESLSPEPQIFWDSLPRQRIKRIDPLWKLFKAQGTGRKVQGEK
jgi:5-formyltetrahydrofolate cyclo-ligase